jgi:hypothetical protein
MTKEEALKATLDYVDPGTFEIENLDLSEEEFRSAMIRTGLIYETKDGTLKKRGPNGIFSTTREGKSIQGLSGYDIEEFLNLGFEDHVEIDKKEFSLQKMPGDRTCLVLDGETVVGFVSPTRDTRCHWISIDGDTRPVMLSFTTQIPPNEKGETPLLEGVWEKGVSKKDASRYDFYHNDVSQKVLASRCVQAVNGHLQKATKAQWIELSFDSIRLWNLSNFDAEFELSGHKFVIEKKSHERQASLKMDDNEVGKLTDRVTRMYKHFTYVEFSSDTVRETLNPKDIKTLLETCYGYISDDSIRQKCIRKGNKKIKSQKVLTSLDQLA